MEVPSGEELVFVSRGAFLLETSAGDSLVTPHHAVLLSTKSPYRVSHPIGGGDDCLILALAPELFARVAGSPVRRTVRIAAGPSFLAQRRLASAAVRPSGALETEERVYEAIAGAAAALGGAQAPTSTRGALRQRRAVRRAEELLASRFAENLSLRDLAAETGLSPWHLSRGFRKHVGLPLHRYRTGLRLRAALARVLDGADDLTALALEYGFFDHSHFTREFRREFGTTPSRVRGQTRRSQPPVPLAFTRAKRTHAG